MKDWLSGIAGFAVIIALSVGYIMNIVQLVQNHYSDGMVIAKVVGILIAPLGVILGWVG